MDEEFNTAGWDAITQAFEKQYPQQTNPLHYGTLVSWRLGGNDPLDGISIYDGGEFWHFVTYGFSELYEKESEDKEYSGYGFELTARLKKRKSSDAAPEEYKEKEPPGIRDEDVKGMVGVLQALARYSFEGGEIFRPYEYIYTGQENGMDPQGSSKITGFITVPDETGVLDTPNGKVEFVQLVGATDRELKAIMNKEITVRELADRLGHTLTDYDRAELL